MSKEAVALKTDYQWQAKSQWKGNKILTCPLELFIEVYLPTKRNTDWDNLHKLSMDACNKIVWEDDKQIWKATVSKHYDKENPRIDITINESL
jgi:Holliday junction resolvase RusA-like endonuclease